MFVFYFPAMHSSHSILSILAAAEVDLFSFDDVGATPAQPSNDAFTFQTAPDPTPATHDDFGDFQEIAPTAPVQFDAFGTGSAPASQQGVFDAFGGSTMNTMQQNHGMMGNQQMGANMNAMNDAFGSMNVHSQQMPVATSAAPASNNDDDFGDFADAEPSAAKTVAKSSDPLSSLISLDGLTKNVKKEKKVDEPAANNQSNQQMGMQNNMGFQSNQPMPVLGSVGTDVGAQNISMMAPPNVGGQMMTGQPNQQQMMGMGGAPAGMNQQQMYQMNMMRQQQMMNANNMQGGNMNAMGMGGQQGMGMGMGMQGSNNMMGMQNNNMMQQQGMMGQQGMNQMMGNNMMGGMGQMNNMNMMGGQPNQFGQFQ